MNTIWIFSLESLETRYTCEWFTHIPQLIKQHVSNTNVVQINGVQKNTATTEGAFLNFSDTNYWKSSQLIEFLTRYNNGEVKPNDQILITDFWNPVVIQLRYMSDLLNLNWKIHGLVHAGAYDPADFLGRGAGHLPWADFTEKAFFHAYDCLYFATDFHIEMFAQNRFNTDANLLVSQYPGRIVRSGWPMEYLEETLQPYSNTVKEDIVVFPHRIAPEKQLDIFKDLAKHCPNIQFVVCQEQKLSKREYHQLLARSKVVFSASLQETLGISPYEGALVGALPLVPDRLSYSEMYQDEFKYPSCWTTSFDSYVSNRTQLVDKLCNFVANYNTLAPALKTQINTLKTQFFAASALLANLKK